MTNALLFAIVGLVAIAAVIWNSGEYGGAEKNGRENSGVGNSGNDGRKDSVADTDSDHVEADQVDNAGDQDDQVPLFPPDPISSANAQFVYGQMDNEGTICGAYFLPKPGDEGKTEYESNVFATTAKCIVDEKHGQKFTYKDKTLFQLQLSNDEHLKDLVDSWLPCEYYNSAIFKIKNNIGVVVMKHPIKVRRDREPVYFKENKSWIEYEASKFIKAAFGRIGSETQGNTGERLSKHPPNSGDVGAEAPETSKGENQGSGMQDDDQVPQKKPAKVQKYPEVPDYSEFDDDSKHGEEEDYAETDIQLEDEKLVAEHSWPWQVLVQVYHENGELWRICGGFLIRVRKSVQKSDIVVTSAFCVSKEVNQQYSRPTIDAHLVKVIAGRHYSLSDKRDGQQRRNVKWVYRERGYNQRGSVYVDYAILKTTSPIRFTETGTIQPICQPRLEAATPLRDANCAVVGWGSGSSKDTRPVIDTPLKQVSMTILDGNVCDTIGFYDTFPFYKDLVICAKPKRATDGVCRGDEGGVLACSVNGKWTVYGVVPKTGEDYCEHAEPAKYPGNSEPLKWIRDHAIGMSELAWKHRIWGGKLVLKQEAVWTGLGSK